MKQLTHENQPPGVTHLYLDAIPDVGGETHLGFWLYAAFDKLSEEFKRFLDGKKAIYVSLHGYLDESDPKIELVHP
ncbi:unnamed protein product [Ambrosiozyma monospora]|uniref:Unnamed protein product n=1 Tax=Ambrosiozyma monospora TaxID=43982 RepID=A0A9W7DIM0_AMBMO|nr:unnamed protein product [Ambrosiozyma monospora]